MLANCIISSTWQSQGAAFHPQILLKSQKNGVLQNDTFQTLQQQALEAWLDYEPYEHLLKIMSLIQQHWSIHAALVEYRLLTSVDSLHQLLGKARLAKQLRVWLTQASENNTGDVF